MIYRFSKSNLSTYHWPPTNWCKDKTHTTAINVCTLYRIWLGALCVLCLKSVFKIFLILKFLCWLVVKANDWSVIGHWSVIVARWYVVGWSLVLEKLAICSCFIFCKFFQPSAVLLQTKCNQGNLHPGHDYGGFIPDPFNNQTRFLVFGHYPVDTGRKLNVHKTFRRRPRSSNLRPVSTGRYFLLLFNKIYK